MQKLRNSALTFGALGGAVLPQGVAQAATPPTAACPGGIAGLICHGTRLVGGGLGAVTDPVGALGGAVGSVLGGSFGQLARDFGQSANSLLHELSSVFVTASTIQFSGTGLNSLFSITLPIAALVAVLLLVVSAASTAWKQDGSALATSLLGLARAGLICTAIIVVVQVCLHASDDLSSWIIARSFGSNQGMQDRLGGALSAMNVVNPSLLLLVAGLAIVLVLLLWAEMLLRHVAVVLLVAMAPIAAAGLTAQTTASWWPKARSALIQLVVLKPLVVLCLGVGFGEFGSASDFNGVIAGLITLAAAVFAWPMLAKFMTFTTVGHGSGLVAAVGGGLGGMAAAKLRGGFSSAGGSSPGDLPGSGYALSAERQNEGVVSLAAGSGGAASAAGAAGPVGAAVLATQAAGAVVQHVKSGVDSMAAHADLGPATSGGLLESLVPDSLGQDGAG